MSFTPAPPLPAPAPPGTGISLGLSVTGRSKKVTARVNFTASAQVETFGRAIDTEKDRADVLVGRGQDEGILRIRVHPEGEFPFGSAVNGSVNIKTARWDLLPSDKRPSAPCTALGEIEGEGGAICRNIKLPHWARPSARGGKLDTEFGIKGAK